jgi:hypothetical protein
MSQYETIKCPRCGGNEVVMFEVEGTMIHTFDKDGTKTRHVLHKRMHATGSHHGFSSYCANPRCGVIFIKEHWEVNASQVPSQKVLRSILQDVASSGGYITYGDLTEMYRRWTGFYIHYNNCWRHPLDRLAEDCLEKGERMLPALVVNAMTGLPGGGFFWGVIKAKSDHDVGAWRDYLRKVHAYWYSRKYRPWRIRKYISEAEKIAMRKAHVEKYNPTQETP